MKTRDPITVGVVATHPPDDPGSMRRYGELLCRCLALEGGGTGGCRSRMVHVGLASGVRRALGTRVGTWCNHAWSFARARAAFARRRVDLWHLVDGSCGYLVPALTRAPVVVTAHDLIPWLQTQGAFPGSPAPSRWGRRLIVQGLRGLARAERIVAVSANTRRDLARAGIVPERVDVVYSAVAPEFLREEPAPDTGAAGPDAAPRILHVGNSGFYKNRPAVLRTFAQVARRLGRPVTLQLVGPPETADEREVIRAEAIGDAVSRTGAGPDEALRRHYHGAALLLFPSLYEGFGWPPLEAMACGCPVVCSRAASLPEVVGDAALTAAPDDEDALARHCLDVLLHPEVAQRLRQRGRQRAAEFSVTRMADGLRAVYARVLGANRWNG